MSFHTTYTDEDGLHHGFVAEEKRNERVQLLAMINKSQEAMQEIGSSEYLKSLYSSTNEIEEEWSKGEIEAENTITGNNKSDEDTEKRVCGVFSPRGKPYIPLGQPDLRRPKKPIFIGRNNLFRGGRRHSSITMRRRKRNTSIDRSDIHAMRSKVDIQNANETQRQEQQKINNRDVGKDEGKFPTEQIQNADRRRKEIRTGSKGFRHYLTDEREDYSKLVPLLGSLRATELILTREEEFAYLTKDEGKDDDTISVATSVVTNIMNGESHEAYMLNIQEDINCPSITLAEQHLSELKKNGKTDKNSLSMKLEEICCTEPKRAASIKKRISAKRSIFRKRSRNIFIHSKSPQQKSRIDPSDFLDKIKTSNDHEKIVDKWKTSFEKLKLELVDKLNDQLNQRKIDKVRVLQDDMLYTTFCNQTTGRPVHLIKQPAIFCSNTKMPMTADLWNKATKQDEFSCFEVYPTSNWMSTTKSAKKDSSNKKKRKERNWKDEVLRFVAREIEYIDPPLQRFIIHMAVELDRIKRLSERKLYKIINSLPPNSAKQPEAEKIIDFLLFCIHETNNKGYRIR